MRSVESGVEQPAKRQEPTPPSTLHTPHSPIAPDAHRAVIAGREIYICNDRAQWQALAKSGAAVFTTNEAERLRPVLSGMTPEEREQAVGQICDAKAILGGYITEARP